MLNKLVSKFPDSRRPQFANASATTFPHLHESLKGTGPGIACTQPGCDVPAKWTWHQCATIVEFHPGLFAHDSKGSASNPEEDMTLFQASTNARNLFLSSGSCFVFILYIFDGDNACIMRFDRVGAVASCLFDWQNDTEALTRYFWRLVHPLPRMICPVPTAPCDSPSRSRIIGADLTITVPSESEKDRMRKTLLLSQEYDTLKKADDALMNSHWMEAIFEGERVRCLTIGPPLWQSTGLYSRATVVWKIMLEGATDPAFYALKDSWQDEDRLSEKTFYKRIATKRSDQDKPVFGLPTCKGSINLWVQEGYGSGQRTVVGALKPETPEVERFHIRSIFFPIGHDVTQFKSTRQLVAAFRDAVKGSSVFRHLPSSKLTYYS